MNNLQKSGLILVILGIASRVALIWVPQCAPCNAGPGEMCIAICTSYLPFLILQLAYKALLILGAVFFVLGRSRKAKA